MFIEVEEKHGFSILRVATLLIQLPFITITLISFSYTDIHMVVILLPRYVINHLH
jgi:hypothetical protein